jgi:trehalose 6-phosphate phosphatase
MEEFSRVEEHVCADVARRGLILMLDFDGTLSPIVPRPDDAFIHKRTKRALVGCAETHTVAIVSGRTLADVKSRVHVPSIWYAGSHGMEWHFGADSGSVGIPPEIQGALSSSSAILEEVGRKFAGTIVERKSKSFAINYRALSEEDAERFSAEGRAAIRDFANSRAIRIIDATRTFEILPEVHWNKGSCVRMLLERANSERPGRLAMYIGDSATDEDAFRELKDGIAIRVGFSSQSNAQYFVPQREDIDALLERLASIPSPSGTYR